MGAAGAFAVGDLAVDKFVANWRGNVFPDQKLDPSNVSGIGFLLGDNKPGPFKLEVEWIKLRKPAADGVEKIDAKRN